MSRELMEKLEPRRLLTRAHMVRDLTPAGLDPRDLTTVGGHVYFWAKGPSDGELWSSDGSAEGTKQLKQISTLDDSEDAGVPHDFVAGTKVLYFFVGDQLWKSDGTSKGTTQLKSFSPPTFPDSLRVKDAATVGNRLFFIGANVLAGGHDTLWTSDGTAAGTVQINPAAIANSDLSGLVSFSGKCFFRTYDTKIKLYSTDGTNAGTQFFKELGTYDSVFSSLSHPFAVLGGTLYFNGPTGLWKSDGTVKGTVATDGTALGADELLAGDNVLYFSTNISGETWLYRSNGTNAGTVRIDTSDANWSSFSPGEYAVVGDSLYLSAPGIYGGANLYRTSTKSSTIQSVASFPTWPYAKKLFSFDNHCYFIAADDVHGQELWKSDGTAAGTVLVKDINPGAANGMENEYGRGSAILNGRLYFDAQGEDGLELWSTDGFTSGTRQTYDWTGITTDAQVQGLTASNGLAYFVADDPIKGWGIYRSDATRAGTIRLCDTFEPDAYAPPLVGLDGGANFYFLKDLELWSTDGTPANTFKVADTGKIRELKLLGGRIYFSDDAYGVPGDLYSVRKGVVTQVKDLNPGDQIDHPDNVTDLTVVGNKMFFFAGDGTYEQQLYVTDGTAGGTKKLTDIHVDFAQRYAQMEGLTALGGKVYFVADDGGVSGDQLWVSDGTVAGTHAVKTLSADGESVGKKSFVVTGNLLYWLEEDGFINFHLWRTDGTEQGTFELDNVAVNPEALTPMNGALYFFAADHTLWKSGGTVATTQAVKGFASADAVGGVTEMVTLGHNLFFTVDGGASGLWQSDGSAARTYAVTDVPHAAGAVKTLATVGGRVFFVGTDTTYGTQPWATDAMQVNFGQITGTIFNDLDRDAVRDPTEPALGGCQVFLDTDNDGVCDSNEPTVRSSYSGRYTFSNLAPGVYQVRLAAMGDRGATTPTAFRVTLAADQRVTRYFGAAGGKISGVIFRDTNRNGVRDPGEAGISRAHLFLDADNDGVWDEGEYIVRTSSSGRYTFSDVPAGTYRIRVFDVPGWTFTNPAVRKVTLPAGGIMTRYLG